MHNPNNNATTGSVTLLPRCSLYCNYDVTMISSYLYMPEWFKSIIYVANIKHTINNTGNVIGCILLRLTV